MAATFSQRSDDGDRRGATLELGARRRNAIDDQHRHTQCRLLRRRSRTVARDATLAISGNYTINGDGSIIFGGNDASIVSDRLDRRHVSPIGSASSIHAKFTGQIGNGAGSRRPDNLTFSTIKADVYASADGVTLTINTGANTVYDFGGLLEADDNGIARSSTRRRRWEHTIFFSWPGSPRWRNDRGDRRRTSGNCLHPWRTVRRPPLERESFGEVVVGEVSVVMIESGGDVAVPVVIETGGILEYSSRGRSHRLDHFRGRRRGVRIWTIERDSPARSAAIESGDTIAIIRVRHRTISPRTRTRRCRPRSRSRSPMMC